MSGPKLDSQPQPWEEQGFLKRFYLTILKLDFSRGNLEVAAKPSKYSHCTFLCLPRQIHRFTGPCRCIRYLIYGR